MACEPEFAANALLKALSLRRAGAHFALSVHVEDVRARRIRDRGRALCSSYASWDEVRLVLDRDAADIAEERAALSEADRGRLYESIRLSDSVIVRSWSEHRRLIDLVGRVARDVETVVVPDPEVPAVVSGSPTDVVVYGPRYRADELAAFAVALGDFEVPVTIVASDEPTIAGRIRFVRPEGAAEALGRARAIIDANGNDPGTALALAKLGRPLAVASDGGAFEILRGVRSYDLWNRRSILAAAANGLSSEAPLAMTGRWEDRPHGRAVVPFGVDAPLVSVIVATFDRPLLLEESLAAIERQEYPSIEVIVVDDGGADVGAVVARHPRARLIDLPVNRGPAAARNRGLREAAGSLAMFFDDDDEMFPDHIAALVRAIERSGLDVAYGQMLNYFVTPGRTDGALAGHTAILDHADIQWAGGALAPTAVLFRRELLGRIGALDESLASAEDYEFWVRLATGREWARVSDVTSMYFIHADGTSYSARQGASSALRAHAAIYDRYPSTRPLVQAGRASMLSYFRRPPAASATSAG